MATINYNTNEQVYNVKEDEGLSSRVALVACVLLQRGIYVAGFSITKELLTIHYSGYNKNKPVWELDFFEHVFNNEPLLAVREMVKAVFICSDKNIIVPDELYAENDAAKWLRHIHFVETKDVVTAFPLTEENAHYLMAAPIAITELIKITCKHAEILPLPIYQFHNSQKQAFHLQCCITAEQVCLTLHNNNQLMWHRVFSYSRAEDIVYEIKLYCRENNMESEKLAVVCNAMSAGEYAVINELTQYFPWLKTGNGRTITGLWDPAVSLANQLFACVS